MKQIFIVGSDERNLRQITFGEYNNYQDWVSAEIIEKLKPDLE